MTRKLVVAVMLGFAAPVAFPQSYPSKVVRLVVPQGLGGTSEIVARSVAKQLSDNLGRQFIVENKGGGAGLVAAAEVARAEPDGHTLLQGHVGLLAMNPAMIRDLPYDSERDFAPVSLLAFSPNMYVVNPSVPAKDLREFVALAKSAPNRLNHGSSGNGSTSHLSFEYLKAETGIELVHVPYKGAGPMLTDLLAGRVQATALGTPVLLSHVKSGRLRALAVGSPRRVAALPEVPTVAESGYPGFENSQWYGLLVPAKTPPAIVNKLSEEIIKALKSESVQARFGEDGTIAAGSTPDEFAALIKRERVRWGDVVRRSGVKAE
jgi:tripartite-type tricarboxylate transporter receptor subunit TctC